MRPYRSRELLKEYVRGIIVEYDMGGVSKGDFYKAFVQPFMDVVDTTMKAAKITAEDIKTSLEVAFHATLTVLVPFYGYDYSETFKKNRANIDKIKSQYKDVTQRTTKALTGGDASLVAFMISPGAFLTVSAFKHKPEFVTGALGFGSASGERAVELINKYGKEAESALKSGSEKLKDISRKLGYSADAELKHTGLGHLASKKHEIYGAVLDQLAILSEKIRDDKEDAKDVLEQVDEDAMHALAQKFVKDHYQMSEDAKETLKKELNEKVEWMLERINSSSLDDLEKSVESSKSAKKSEALASIKSARNAVEKSSESFDKKTSGKQKIDMTDLFQKGLKKSAKDMFADLLETEKKSVLKNAQEVGADVASLGDFVSIYDAAITKIKSA